MNVEEQEEKSTKEGGKVISKERKKRQEEKVSTCDAKELTSHTKVVLKGEMSMSLQKSWLHLTQLHGCM